MSRAVTTLGGSYAAALGIMGFARRNLFGMHLNPAHNVVHLATGVVSLLAARSKSASANRRVQLGLAVTYGLLAAAGFLFGRRGRSRLGNTARDARLLQVVPGFLEIGSSDHVNNVLTSAAFLVDARPAS